MTPIQGEASFSFNDLALDSAPGSAVLALLAFHPKVRRNFLL